MSAFPRALDNHAARTAEVAVALLRPAPGACCARTLTRRGARAQVLLSTQSPLKDSLAVSVVDSVIRSIERGDAVVRRQNTLLLAMMLTNGGAGVKRNQDMVTKLWLMDGHRSHLLFDTFTAENGMVQLRVRPPPPDAGGDATATVRTFDLESLTSAEDELSSGVYAVYQAQLELIIALCAGCNAQVQQRPALRARRTASGFAGQLSAAWWALQARAHVSGGHMDGEELHLSYGALLHCIGNERLPTDLRCLYTRVMLAVFVEVCSRRRCRAMFRPRACLSAQR